MKVSKKRYNYSFKEGKRVEDDIKKILNKKGYKIEPSSDYQDQVKHIDFFVNKYGVDAKANKHIDNIWLELKNINGNDGWLYGKAFYIIIEIVELNYYSIFKREDLLKYAQTFKEYTDDKNEFYKIYTRKKWNRKDEIIKVKYDDIKPYEIKKLYKL